MAKSGARTTAANEACFRFDTEYAKYEQMTKQQRTNIRARPENNNFIVVGKDKKQAGVFLFVADAVKVRDEMDCIYYQIGKIVIEKAGLTHTCGGE